MYYAGIYSRVSIGETKGESEYSNSIHSQFIMGENYALNSKEIIIEKKYADDGISGRNFNRPAFKKMIEDIRKGVINTVIVKDLSRLGRNHIETAYYMEKFFPMNNVRFISVLDGYDSKHGTDGDSMKIKSLINEMYIKDTSKKIKIALEIKHKNGEYTFSQPPFGYIKSKTVHNSLEIDDYSAEIVKRIFKMYIQGLGQRAIATKLNEEKIPAPGKYKKDVLKINYPYDTGRGLWTKSAVSGILQNETYKGIRPIVSRDDFEKARAIRNEKRNSPEINNKNKRTVNRYRKILYCAHCGMAMRKTYTSSCRRFDGYVCATYREIGKKYCSSNYIETKVIDEIICKIINETIVNNIFFMEENRNPLMKKQLEKFEKQKNIEEHINQKKQNEIYKLFLDEQINKKQFMNMKNEIRKKTNYDNRKNSYEKIKKLSDKLKNGNISESDITEEFLKALVYKIYISKNNQLTIIFNINP